MALLNYSTTVDAYKTVAEIEQMLVRHGAKSIMKSYEGEDVTSLSFLIDTGNGNVPVKLPVRLDDVLQVLTEQKDVDIQSLLSPIEQTYNFVRDKKSKFHQEYVSTYYALTPYIEEVAESLKTWISQYEKAEDEDEKEKLKLQLNAACKDVLKQTISYIESEMKKIAEMESRYEKDYENAQETLERKAPLKESDPFSQLANLNSSFMEERERMKKYDTGTEEKRRPNKV